MANDLYQILIGVPVATAAGYLCADAAHAFNISENNDGLIIGLRQYIMAGTRSGVSDLGLQGLANSLAEGPSSQEQEISYQDRDLHAVYVYSIKEVMETRPIGPISWISKKLTLKSLRKKQRNLELRLRLIQAN